MRCRHFPAKATKRNEVVIGMEKITLCGDDCLQCPRYLAKSEEELKEVALLWNKVGWRNHVVSNDEIKCDGCTSHKECTYRLVECIRDRGIAKCNQCTAFPCEKIEDMLTRSRQSQEKCQVVCTPQEYKRLEASFFHKWENLNRL